jgi:tetratricopeptide (TPR) repeat protein
MRQLIQTSNSLANNLVRLKGGKDKKEGKGVATTALIEYYTGGNFGVRNDANGKEGEVIAQYSVNDIVTSLILLDNHMYTHIISDYEMKKCEHIFTSMISKYSMCHEAYFGLGKILLSKNELEHALEMLELSLRAPKRDPVYLLWTALTLYYLFKRCQSQQTRKLYAKKIEEYTMECITQNNNDLNALFILLQLVSHLVINKYRKYSCPLMNT